MTWTILVNGNSYPIAVGTAPAVDLKLNALDSFTVYVDNTNVSRGDIGKGNPVVISFQGNTIISGYCDLPKWGKSAIRIQGQERARELLYELILIGGTHYVEYEETDVSTILATLLALVGYTLDAVDRPGAQDISVRFFLRKILDGVIEIADIMDMDWYFVGTELHMVADRGSNKGELFNFVIVDKDDDYDDIENQIILYYTDKDGNRSYVTGNNAASQGLYGVMQGSAVSNVVYDAATAQLLADAMAADLGDLPVVVTARQSIAEVLSRGLSVGDDVAYTDIERELANTDTWEIRVLSYRGATVTIKSGTKLKDTTGEMLRNLEIATETEYTPINVNQLPTGIQGWGTNLQARPGVAAANIHNSFEWDDGLGNDATIKFADGTTITITAGNHAGLAASTNFIYYVKSDEDPTTLYLAASYDDLDEPNAIPVLKVRTPAAVNVTENVEMWPLFTNVFTPPVIGSAYLSAGVIVTPDFRTAWNVGNAGGPPGVRVGPGGVVGYSGGVTKGFWLNTNGLGYFMGGDAVLGGSGLVITNSTGGEIIGVYFNIAGAVLGAYLGIGTTGALLIKQQIATQTLRIIHADGQFIYLESDGEININTAGAGGGADVLLTSAGDIQVWSTDIIPEGTNGNLGRLGAESWDEIHGDKILASERMRLPVGVDMYG